MMSIGHVLDYMLNHVLHHMIIGFVITTLQYLNVVSVFQTLVAK